MSALPPFGTITSLQQALNTVTGMADAYAGSRARTETGSQVYQVSEFLDGQVCTFAVTRSLTLAMKAIRHFLEKYDYLQVKAFNHHVPGGNWEYTSDPDIGLWLVSCQTLAKYPDGTPVQAEFWDSEHDEWVGEDDWQFTAFSIIRYDVIESANTLPDVMDAAVVLL